MIRLNVFFEKKEEVKVEEINALCKQTSAYGDSLYSSLQADVLFYILDVCFIFKESCSAVVQTSCFPARLQPNIQL